MVGGGGIVRLVLGGGGMCFCIHSNREVGYLPRCWGIGEMTEWRVVRDGGVGKLSNGGLLLIRGRCCGGGVLAS